MKTRNKKKSTRLIELYKALEKLAIGYKQYSVAAKLKKIRLSY